MLLAWSTSAAADPAKCKAVLRKAQERYLITVAKIKAKEARGRRWVAKQVPPEVSAAKIASAALAAQRAVGAACAGVPTPQDIDPNVCPGKTDFDSCVDDSVSKANASVAALDAALLPQCFPNSACGPSGLPSCNADTQCFCHSRVEEGQDDCVDAFSCEGAERCAVSADCGPGQACYVNTCCGPDGVCGPTTCSAPGSVETLTGRTSSILD
jgi:hypothetical protein